MKIIDDLERYEKIRKKQLKRIEDILSRLSQEEQIKEIKVLLEWTENHGFEIFSFIELPYKLLKGRGYFEGVYRNGIAKMFRIEDIFELSFDYKEKTLIIKLI